MVCLFVFIEIVNQYDYTKTKSFPFEQIAKDLCPTLRSDKKRKTFFVNKQIEKF